MKAFRAPDDTYSIRRISIAFVNRDFIGVEYDLQGRFVVLAKDNYTDGCLRYGFNNK